MRQLTALMARFFLSFIFFISGVNKIIHWQDTEKELLKILNDWAAELSFSVTAQMGISTITVWAPGFLMAATLLELVGALLLLLGVKERLGAFFLILFLIPTTFLFHPFWFMEGGSHDLQASLFLRNLAIMGGLMMVTLYGTKEERGARDSFSLEKMG